MHWIRCSLLLAVICAVPKLALGENVMQGLGAMKCSWLGDQLKIGDGFSKNSFTTAAMFWIQGFVSGTNLVLLQNYRFYFDMDSIGREEQWAYVVEYCRRNPDVEIARGVTEMTIQRLRKTSFPDKQKN